MTVTAPRTTRSSRTGGWSRKRICRAIFGARVGRRTVPIPSWQFSLGAAPFSVEHCRSSSMASRSRAWVYPQERDDSLKWLRGRDRAGARVLRRPHRSVSYDKLAQKVEVDNRVGRRMELASDIFYGYRGVPGRQLVAHEMAHQWFGDSATERDWDDVWLSEGFATYFALLYTEHADGRDAFLDGAAAAPRARSATTSRTRTRRSSTTTQRREARSSRTTRRSTGAAPRCCTCSAASWAPTGSGRASASTTSGFGTPTRRGDDFRRAMEDACVASGQCPDEDRDLTWFFHQWLNRGGVAPGRPAAGGTTRPRSSSS